MSKKKSYMDKNNIITEGFFGKLAKVLGLSSSQEKQLKKDKKIQNIINDLNSDIKELNSDVKEFERLATKAYKNLGIDRKVDITKYKLKDFI